MAPVKGVRPAAADIRVSSVPQQNAATDAHALANEN